MKKIFGFFTKRWVVSLLGVVALCLLIWYVGPLIAIAGKEPLAGVTVRLIVIALTVVIWGGYALYKKVKAVLNNNKLMAGLALPAKESTPDYGAEEVALLKERFDEAMTILKQSRKKKRGGGQSLYDLPWYVIIGPPGSGKTTALINSGLEFPLTERLGSEALQGVGGTRNCDWWFSNSAVLIDTAGRYVTQDSHEEVDSAAWTGFLDLLKKHRRRRPVNGVMVTISLSDLMLQNEQERKFHVSAIKQRIHELYQHFGIRLPVYVLLTKCDLIAGFMEFFEDLGKEEREQVWGMTFPLLGPDSSSGALDGFSTEFDKLLRRVNERLIWRLSQERDNKRRTLIYGFPQQLTAIKETLEPFLRDVFQASPIDEPVTLRGIYLTSGTQEGTPIDRVMGSLARSFGMNQQMLPSFGGQNRAYFITDLLKKVIIPEAQLAGTNRRLERQMAWMQNGAYIGTAALALLCVAAWATSYMQNKAYIESVAQKVSNATKVVDALSPAQRDPIITLPALNAVKDIARRGGDEGIPLSMGFGLYQGDKLGAKAWAVYQRLLGTIFLPRVILRLEEQLRSDVSNTDYLFEGLKVYLMFREKEHFDAENIHAWVSLDWDRTLPSTISPEFSKQLNDHLTVVLEDGPPLLSHDLDNNLIKKIRHILKAVPLEQRIYGRLKRAGLGREIPQFRITEAGGLDTPIVFSRKSARLLNEGVDGLFTHAGFHNVFLKESDLLSNQLLEESWILDEEEAILDKQARYRLKKKVRRLYMNEYIYRWETLLSDIRLEPFTSLDRAVGILNVLSSGANSPLRQMLIGVSQETALTKITPKDGGLVKKGAAAVSAVKERLSDIIGGGRERQMPDSSSEKPGMQVENHFSPIHRLVQAREDGTLPVDDILQDFNELYVYLDAIASSANQGQAALDAVKGSSGLNNIIRRLKLKAKQQPPFMRDMIIAATDSSRYLAVGGVRKHMNAMWSAGPLQFCRQAISERYPVVSRSSRDVTLKDFGQFFGPGGTMESFYNDYLVDFVDTTTVPWQWRGKGGISEKALEQFRRAQIIKETFFQSGGQTPSVQFELRPIRMDKTINRFLFDLNGQKMTYRHGPIRLSKMQWPGPDGTNEIYLQFIPAIANGPSTVRKTGPWAWFKVLDQSNIVSTSRPERYQVTFDIGGRKARYELFASSTKNPFRFKELTQFRCVEKL